MTSDNMPELDNLQDGFDTALIDAFVDQAEIADVAEPMTGLGVSLGNLSICDTIWLDGPDTKTENYPLGLAQAKASSSVGRKEAGRNTSIHASDRLNECREPFSELLWMPADIAIRSLAEATSP